MRVDDALATIRSTGPDDWVAFESPVADDEAQPWVATYREDVLLQLHFGRRVSDENFDEPWVKEFPSPQAYMFEVEMTYAGSLLSREHAMSVDGGRYFLPVPKLNRLGENDYEFHMTKEQEVLGRLLHEIVNGHTGYPFDAGVETAGLKRVDD